MLKNQNPTEGITLTPAQYNALLSAITESLSILRAAGAPLPESVRTAGVPAHVPSVDPIAEVFARAVVELQSQDFVRGQKYIYMAKDHVVLERLAAEFGIIPSYRSHVRYIAWLNQAEKDFGITFSHKPKNRANLSYYVNAIRLDEQGNWKCGSTSPGEFRRYQSLAHRLRSLVLERYVLSPDTDNMAV